MIGLPQHDLRKPLTDELHSRPFLPIEAPARVSYFAFLPEQGAARHSPEQDLEHLNALLRHLGATPVEMQDGRAPIFHLGSFEGGRFKWERHTEFITIMFAFDRGGEELFELQNRHIIPEAWMEESRLRTIAASMVEILPARDEAEAESIAIETVAPCFERDSLVMTWVTERAAIAVADFRIDENGFTRFGVVTLEGQIGPRRTGRVAQRLIEMETYRVMAMLALPLARRLGPELSSLAKRLTQITRGIAESQPETDAASKADLDAAADQRTLAALTSLSTDLEKISAETGYRFNAAKAYESIVYERIEAIREKQLHSRQSFAEFMARRFAPALRTIRSTEERLKSITARGERAANLLRTRIDVALETQNQKLLKSMDRRADLQLRLQQTVEGLSVVAISYYAVSLAGYMLGPLFKWAGGDKTLAMAVVALPIIGVVYWMVSRLRKHLEK